MKIVHAYSDLLNLYGEYANVSALARLLTQNGHEVEIEHVTIGQPLRLSDCDFLYIGAGTERKQKRALAHLRGYADELRAYVERGGAALLTGNALEMLGKSITDADGVEHAGLGLFDFTVREQRKTRITGDAIVCFDELPDPLIGFVNRCSTAEGMAPAPFTVDRGPASDETARTEGVRRRNLFGTYLTGPLLVKNPHFLHYFASLAVGGLSDVAFCREKLAYATALTKLREK